ncbi:Uncharacterized protein APZ42_021191 [Daphnia magna]|uniref:Uncharacterized protein n=1 Tax=Daphnia magna TaxID=35525 RepID=A0A164X254_9CRUS|nr:Uncharacterized protein APZ42_021191 [Daphnia magna]
MFTFRASRSFDHFIHKQYTVVGVTIECGVGCESPPQRIDGFLISQVDPGLNFVEQLGITTSF